MKGTIVIPLLIAAYILQANAEYGFEKTECLEKHNVTVDDVLAFRLDPEKDRSDDFKCFTSCFLQRIGLQVYGLNPPEVTREQVALGSLIYASCLKASQYTNVCDTGYILAQCLELLKLDYPFYYNLFVESDS